MTQKMIYLIGKTKMKNTILFTFIFIIIASCGSPGIIEPAPSPSPVVSASPSPVISVSPSPVPCHCPKECPLKEHHDD